MSEQEREICFVIAPISDSDTEIRKRSDLILKYIIGPAADKCGYKAIRADEISKSGIIPSEVIHHIINDPIIVADLTGSNPNVFYELAIRHALRRPYIQIIQKGEEIPFDVAGVSTIEVDLRDLDNAMMAKDKIVELINSFKNRESEVESPISVSIDLEMLRRSENPERIQIADIFKSMSELISIVSSIERNLLDRDESRKWGEAITLYDMLHPDLNQKRIKELKTLSTYLAHSFLIPIQVIVSKTENLQNKFKHYHDPELMESCYEILNETIKFSYLADNLRDWMTEENDIYNFDTKERVNLHGILRYAVQLYRSEAFRKGILLNDPIPRDMPFPTIKGSEPHLKKVFINLINNAVKYSFDGYPDHFRYIESICRPSENYYCVEIINLGVGIMPDELEKIFEYGYRGKMARDRNRFGSGLGLPTVKRIVEKHGGRVEAESRMVGQFDGSKRNPYKTTLRVFLPYD